MKKEHSADFKTGGNWIIPGIIGWSKSTVSIFGRAIGIMYTLHLTEYINIGFNNPHPLHKPKNKTEESIGMETCDCAVVDDESLNGNCESCHVHCACGEKMKRKDTPYDIAYQMAEDFRFNADPTMVFSMYPVYFASGTYFTFVVSSLDVFVPDEFNRFKTRKVVRLPNQEPI